MMKKETILWADDEIDLLKPHILFLQQKGYEVTTVTNGLDAVEASQSSPFDLIILDENMPGLSGLQTLSAIKEQNPQVPILMITKSEEENIMNQAIGNKIADYLIKPVNPNQILLSIKKNLNQKEIISQNTTSNYQQDFARLSMLINNASSWEDWSEIYRKLVYWDLELAQAQNMEELIKMQKVEANSAFVKYIKKNYESWFEEGSSHPMLSHELFKTEVFPLLDKGEKVFVILLDNFRFDQWRVLMPMLAEFLTVQEKLYCSILPTATQYARNSIFSGLLPLQIAKLYPEYWVEEEEEEGKNLNEEPLLQSQLDRFRKKYSFSYHKINESSYGEKLTNQLSQIERHPLNVAVLNFIDMLSHARTESRMIRELASTESAYRSITESWFRHSSTLDLIRKIAEKGYKILLTTDHGTVHVDNPIKIIGDRNTNTNLRYKVGKSLSYNPRQVYEIKYPAKVGLPSPNVSSTYVFATNRDFLAYPNNYNYYVGYYKNTFQHGGISMEEMMIPLITLELKK